MTGPRGGRRILATITLESHGAGVTAVSHLLWRALQDRWPSDHALLTLQEDDGTPLTWRAKARFSARLASAQVFGRARWVLFGHLGLVRAQALIPAPLRRPYGVFFHGVEVWRALSEPDRRLLRGATLRVANSSYTANRVMAMHPDIGDVQACPLSLAQAEEQAMHARGGPASPPQPPAVLMVGRLDAGEAYKGHAQMIDAWPRVLAHVPDAELVIVGSGDDRVRLEALARRLGVHERVRFLGYLDREALHQRYAAASVFALPSRGEGFGIVYLEAMAHRLPCIGSSHDAAGDVIVEGVTGFLVPQDDPRVIADRVARLLTDEPLRRQMGEAGFRRVQEEFTFARFASCLIDLIDRTLEPAASLGAPAAARRGPVAGLHR